MAFLGLDFIISSLIWLFLISIFVFVFRKQIQKLFYKKSSFDLFISKLKNYLQKTYPKTKFNFDIIEKSKIEANPDTRKYLIIDNIIDQYLKLKLDNSKFPQGMPKELHWSGYAFHSEPNKNKIPKDWLKRKNAVLIREKKECFRCSKKVDINSIQIHLIKDIAKGGKYFLENLIGVCRDCEKILSNDSKKMNHLDIKEDLNKLIKD
ncbi:MAG: HNH endonuclease signature motif containing protein [Campylobacterota bacterium]|nr:HNH endonuclease signature motif containing protein [Campylobacterota bacterium]